MKELESYYESLKENANKLKQAKNDEFTNLTGIRVEVYNFNVILNEQKVINFKIYNYLFSLINSLEFKRF